MTIGRMAQKLLFMGNQHFDTQLMSLIRAPQKNCRFEWVSK